MMSEALQEEISLNRLIEILSTTIKFDDVNKCIVFLAMLLAQTEDSQLNIIMSQQSCTGKSYILQSIAEYFPKEEVIVYANASPTALIHSEASKLRYKSGNGWHYIRKGDKVPKGKQVQRVIDYERKNIIFLDQPKPELLTRLRAFLSHDSKECLFSTTDRTTNGTMRAVENVLIGFSSVFFATVEPSLDMQESTRAIILSPETSRDKNEEATKLGIERKTARDEYMESIDNHPDRIALKELVREIRASGIRDVTFSSEEVKDFVFAYFDMNDMRVVRDVEKFLSLAKGWALLNFKHRERVNTTTIRGTRTDLEVAFKLYEPIMTPNTLGIRPEIWQFYCDILKQSPYPLSAVQIQEQYLAKYKRGIGLDYLRKYLKVLEEKGLVVTERSQADARVIMYSAVKRSEVASL